jgi:hypothetical protein
MFSFTQTNLKVLVTGALVLAAGVYYEGVASQRVGEAERALRQVESAQSRLQAASDTAREYSRLLASMSDRKIDRQEPFSVISEFSPEEIRQIGPLLDTLYQRDGHFFLERFHLAWMAADAQRGLPARVALDLEGRKVLLFSDETAGNTSLAAIQP